MKYPEYPKVSVIVSTYERPEKLRVALASIAAQTFSDYEVIVVDDCSPSRDAVWEALEAANTEFETPGIDLFAYRLESNSGYQCFPKNRGIERARGDYIAYLDDDNTWESTHLSTLVAAIEADFSTDLVYSRLRYHIEDESIRTKLTEAFGGRVPEGDALGVPWQPVKLSAENFVDTSTVLHSKGAFWRLVRESGYGWDETLRRFGDWNFIWRWAVHGLTGKLVDAVTVNYNWHAGSLQLTRPAIETPVCFNYAQYQALRREPASVSPSVS